MMTLLLSARLRVTEFWDERFVWPRNDEIALSLTGHTEEVFVRNCAVEGAIFEIREVKRFRLTRRQAMCTYRIIGRNRGRSGPVKELVWAVQK